MTKALDYAQENASKFQQELVDLLKIPSISTDPAFSAQVREAADWLIDDFNFFFFFS